MRKVWTDVRLVNITFCPKLHCNPVAFVLYGRYIGNVLITNSMRNESGCE